MQYPFGRKHASSIQRFVETRSEDYEYLQRQTAHFGCYIVRDTWALQIANHSNLEQFNDEEWAAFAHFYRDVISRFEIYEIENARIH